MKAIISLNILVLFLLCLAAAQNVQKLELEQPYVKELNKDKLQTRYYVEIKQAEVTKLKSDRWYFFVEVEPNVENEWTPTTIEISTVERKNVQQVTNDSLPYVVYGKEVEGKKVRTCEQKKGGVDSCFLTSSQFNYKNQYVFVKITCQEKCKFKISAQINSQFTLKPRDSLKLDFENTAYSKVFYLDTRKQQNFDQLNIILKPETFLLFPAPINLYVNKGKVLPTKDVHDFRAITLWDDGVGVFLEKSDAVGQFTIVVEGPEKNVLLLETQLISLSKTNELKKNLPFFDYLNVDDSKKYKVKIDPSLGVVFHMSTFSGAIKLLKLYDESLTEIDMDEVFPPLFKAYGELEYQIPAQFFSKNKKKYNISEYMIFEVSGVKESTFVLEYSDISKSIAHLLPERTRYVDIAGSEYNQYYIQFVQLEDSKFTEAKFELIITTEQKQGQENIELMFFGCKKQHGKDCELRKSQLESTKVENSDLSRMQSKMQQHLMDGVIVYKFSIPSNKFMKMKEVKKFIFVIVIKNKSSKMELYTIQYIDNGKNIYLKENFVRKDRIQIDQSKYYVYTNLNKDVKEIRAHIMEISGRVESEGYVQDPRLEKNKNIKAIQNYRNTIAFTEVKENQSIYLRVEGIDMAYYSVQLQLIKTSQKEQNNNSTKKNDSKGYNEIVLGRDISYQFNIPPNSKEVYQIQSKDHIFMLEMSSSLPLELCLTQNLNKAPFSPNCDETIGNFSKSTALKTRLQKGDIGVIGVTNNNDKSVKFHIRYYKMSEVIIPEQQKEQKPINPQQPKKEETKKDDSAVCIPVLMGKIIKQQLKKGLKYCFSYQLTGDKNKDIELTLDVLNDQYDQVNAIIDINKQEKLGLLGSTHLFKAEQIKKDCEGLSTCSMKIILKPLVDTQIRFALQYLTETFYLLDGIANEFSGNADRRTFAYELYNKLNTTIMLQNKRTNYIFYGKIVQANSYWAGNQKFPTKDDKIVQSSDPFYYRYQIAVLSEQKIKESKCKQCMLLLTVQNDPKIAMEGKTGKFIIECTQEDRNLNEGKPLVGYIQKKSVAFYEYYNRNNGTIIVNINSQNKQCVTIYMSKGNKKRASPSSPEQKSLDSNLNTLIYQKAEVGAYSITLQARQNCHYTIEVSVTADKSFTNLARGKFKDIKLEKAQSKKFLYQNYDNETIKLLTVNQNGQILINVKVYPNLKAFLDDKSTKLKYDWSGIDYIRIQPTDAKFCSNCVYIFNISSERSTSASLMITSKASEFPIQVDSVLKDELKKNEIEKLRVFTSEYREFQVSVQYGAIEIAMYNSDGKEILRKTYTESKTKQYETLKAQPENKTYIGFMQFRKIQIKAINDSVFTYSLISNEDQSKRGNKIKLGVPEYLTLEKNTEQCVSGVLDDDSQIFLISITGSDQEKLMNALEVRCMVDNNTLQLSKNIAKNEMIIKIERRLKVYPRPYEFCLQIKQPIYITFIQSSRLNYLAQRKQTLIIKSMNFSFYAEGKTLIELNECESRAIATISTSFNDITAINSEIRQVRKSNNIIQFSHFGPIFLNVQAISATISWRKKNLDTGEGTAYDLYTNNKIRIDKVGNELKVEVFPPKKITKDPKIKLSNINYKVFLAEEQSNLYNAMNCNNGVYLERQAATIVYDENDSVMVFFEIENILQKFGGKKYLFIGVIVTVTSSLESDGTYRFLYPYQEIPISLLKTGITEEDIQNKNPNPKPQPNPKPITKEEQDSSFNTFVLYFSVLVVVGFLGIWIYSKYLKKCMKKRSRERLSEQQVNYQQFTSYKP